MDYGSAYIKMCDCSEIQQLCPSPHDYGEYINYTKDIVIGISKRRPIWLPRQDQLQDMVGDNTWYEIRCYPIEGRRKESEPYELVTFEYTLEAPTLEQLWLAFVMKTLHSKIWSGDTWVASC